MSNAKYIQEMIGSSERIYIDTATLMEEGMQQFISNNETLLASSGRKLIVPQTVRSELARHLDSDVKAKCECAMRAIGLISSHPDLFEVEDTPLSDEVISKAFADAQLLSELTLHKGECDQLLITNDRRLSRDAFCLNQQESCKGHRIKVCYINHFGQLHCCDCVKEFIEARKSQLNQQSVPVVEEPNEEEPSTEAQNDGWHFDLASAGLGITFVGLVGFGLKNYKSILRLFV